MKLSFSTLGCPDWTFGEMLAIGKDLGYKGIEIRGIEDEIYTPKCRVFSPEKIEETKQLIANKGIAICCLTSQAELGFPHKTKYALAEAKDYILLANRLGVKYVRVFCSNSPFPIGGSYEHTLDNYVKLCSFAEEYNVTPLLETNGILCDTSLLKKLMESVPNENKGVIWDVHHPFRYNNEKVSDTVSNIGQYVKHIHIKDSIEQDGRVIYKMMGYGDNPNKEAVLALRELGYDGFYSLEWVKRWNKELEAPSIVFSHYIHYMKNLLR